jgi:hypothetical protein
MHPLVRGAAAAAVLTALGSFDRKAPEPAPLFTPGGEARGVDGLPAPCLPGTLPEGPVCLRIPGENEGVAAGLAAVPTPLPGRPGLVADRIPRRPERPADPAAYLYPVGEPDRPPRVMDGLDQPGVRLAVRPGAKIALLALAGQVGPAEVIFTGDLFGRTVVTAHTVDNGARKQTYLLFHGGLDHPAPGVVPGARLEAGEPLGFAPTEAGGGLIYVYFEAREVRDGARIDGSDPRRLADTAVSISTDVRNVLPLR